MKITVIQNDIDCGTRSNAQACPIARAARRKFGLGFGHVRVTAGRAWIDGTVYELSQPACDFICRFDSGDIVHPAAFVLHKR